MPLTRSCPFKDCPTLIGDTFFACRKHWLSMSWRDRSCILQAYRQYVDHDITIEVLRQTQFNVMNNYGGHR